MASAAFALLLSIWFSRYKENQSHRKMSILELSCFEDSTFASMLLRRLLWWILESKFWQNKKNLRNQQFYRQDIFKLYIMKINVEPNSYIRRIAACRCSHQHNSTIIVIHRRLPFGKHFIILKKEHNIFMYIKLQSNHFLIFIVRTKLKGYQ